MTEPELCSGSTRIWTLLGEGLGLSYSSSFIAEKIVDTQLMLIE